jgi:DNA-directed RNA polymerase specialized sigma24 family protein
MATEGCGDANAVQGMALELFQLASLLVGSQDNALALIETSLATMQLDPCLDPEAARTEARRFVVRGALEQLAHQNPSAFAAPVEASPAHDPCIQDDDLQASGVTPSQLQELMNNQGSEGLRVWLEGLPVAQRTVFVQRAVLGQNNDATASMLRQSAGETARDWTPQAVSNTFRQALCSLANSLAHAPAPDPMAV